MSKNLIFFIMGIISIVLTYVYYQSLPNLVGMVASGNLPREFTRMLQNSELVTFAGFVSLFGLSFFLLYIVFPISYVWYHIFSAKRIIATLPLISNATKRTNKKTFLSQFKGLGFIEKLALSYGPYLIQGPEEEVKAEALKNIRIIKKNASNSKNEKLTISPVRATVPAGAIFNVDSLVIDHLFLGFFTVFARIMIGSGIICIGISIISFSFVQGKGEMALLTALQPGIMAFLYLLATSVIILGLAYLVDLVLSQSARSLARMINGVFHQNEWQQDINSLLTSNSASEQFEDMLQSCLDKPMKDIARAVKVLAVEQEKKLDNILSKTLVSFFDNMEKKSGTDIGSLNKTLKDTAHTANLMKKQFTDANTQFSKQMDKQIAAISKHLAEMQKVLSNSEKTTQKGTEKIVSTLTTKVQDTYGELAIFMETSLNKLDDKHKALETAVSDKEGILKDLHSSAKDLGTISNASGMLLERFISLSTELDNILKNIREKGIDRSGGNAENRDKLKLAVMELKKSNKDRVGKLPKMK